MCCPYNLGQFKYERQAVNLRVKRLLGRVQPFQFTILIWAHFIKALTFSVEQEISLIFCYDKCEMNVEHLEFLFEGSCLSVFCHFYIIVISLSQ